MGNGLEVSALGLGCMSMTSAYGPAADQASMTKLIRSAHEQGVTLFDTAEAYGPFANEELLGEALQPIREQVVFATKFVFDIDLITGARGGGTNSRPEHIRAPARIGGGTVTFEPGARTAWHTHPLGQTLIVTAGVGYVQQEGGARQEIRPGDSV